MTTFQGEGSYDITKRYLLILFKSAHCLKEKKKNNSNTVLSLSRVTSS